MYFHKTLEVQIYLFQFLKCVLVAHSCPTLGVMYGCERWAIKKAECRRIDAFELWCWRRLPLQSPKDCSIQLCLFCCLAYRVNVTIFLNSIYMR